MDQDSNEIRGDYRDNWKHIDWAVNIYSTKDYVVYIDKDDDLDWETKPAYETRARIEKGFDLAKHIAVLNDAALFDATPCDDFPRSTKIQFKRLIGEAIGCSLDHDYVGDRNMLIAASDYLRARSEELSRYWYLTSSSAMTLPFLCFGIATLIWRATFTSIFGSTTVLLTLAAVAGGTGAYFQ